MISVVLFSSFRSALAADLTNTWDFSSPGNYSFDSGVEASGGVARLKAQNYSSDANTAALYHADDASGSSLSDSSSNNNSATLTNTSWVTGKLNGGIEANGNTSNIQAADSSSLSLTQSNTLEGWLKLNSTFNAGSSAGRQNLLDKGPYKLYLDEQTGKAVYELQNSSASNWQQQGGGSVNNSWDYDGKNTAEASVGIGNDLYVGTGNSTAGDAEVWKQSSGGVWTRIGGSGLNGSWAASTYESIASLATDGTNLYAGTGTSSGDGEVWKWDGSTWTRIGGDGLNSSWAVSTYEAVLSLDYFGGSLYAGTGTGSGDGEVWKYTGGSWTQIGGDGLNSSWAAAFKVNRLENDGTNLYAGTGNTAGMADVWRWNGSAWTQIGGDGLNSSWAASTYEEVLSSYYMGGNLYIGLGTSSGDAEVWRWNGSAWSKLASSGVGFPAATYEGVYSLGGDGTNLYAGTGSGTGDGDVWKYNGSTWTQVGGDGLNSGWTGATTVSTITYVNSKLYANGIFGASSSIPLSSFNGTVWTIEGGQYYKGSWGYNGFTSVSSMTSHKGKLYAGLVSAYGGAFVFEFNGTNWTLVGGNSTNDSWVPGTYNAIDCMTSFGDNLVVGVTGTTVGDSEVWSYNGSTWSKIGGDGTGSSWNTNYSSTKSIAASAGILYAGVGSTGNNGEVWKYESNTWSKIGGGGTNSSWSGVFRHITSMSFYNGELVIGGTGSVAASAEVWKWSGSTWSKIGGDGTGSSWNTATYLEVNALSTYQGNLYAGVGGSVGDGELWKYNGNAWSQVGGDSMDNSWDGTTHRRVNALSTYNGDLYVGTAGSAGDGDVWKYNGSAWSQVGGDSLNSGWTNSITSVMSLLSFKGKLYTGLGTAVSTSPLVYSVGSNGYLESATTGFDTEWRHFAATYDGTTMKLYINGQLDASLSVSLSMSDTTAPLFLGSGQGSPRADAGSGVLAGRLDEVRISNTARSSFTTKPYTSSTQGVILGAAVRQSGVSTWESLAASETTDGGAITYQLSDDGGATWKYWSGSAWLTATTAADANAISVTNTNIGTFPVTFGGITWKALLTGNGDQQVTLNSVTLGANSDVTAPETNATSIVGYKSNGGAAVADNAWTNGGSPYFSWTAGNDGGAGLLGYCLYLGQDNTADPVSTKGLLGTSPVTTGSHCQFVVSGTNIDLATSGYLQTALSSSNTPYYLRVKAIDKAGNTADTATQFSFRFDNTVPTNPSYITSPSGFINTKQATLTWPTAGGQAASDANAGLAGLQYRINNGTWYGDSHSGSGDVNDLLTNDGSYDTTDPPDFTDLVDGVNTIYLRTWDLAGNVTTSYTTAALKINTNGSPSEPQNLQATPSTNTANSFAFSWSAPATFVGDASTLTYCYSVNVVPSALSCSYTAAGITSLAAGAYATQPGTNTLYVVARDESSNISYSNYASVNFTANTPAPGLPLNVDVADVSVKTTSNWRLAITWDAPTFVGAGVSSYKVYRSTDNSNFTLAGSSSSTSFVDTGLQQNTYYYRIKACDSANNCSANSTVASGLPTGKFTSPAGATSDPIVSDTTTKRAKISWSTDRASDSKVLIGTTSGSYSASEVGNSSQVTAHTIDLDNLAAGTTYYFKARWTDEDGNTGESQEAIFKTAPAPVLKEVNTLKVSLSGATIQFTTKDATKADINFGKSDSFGGVQKINTSTSESTYTTELGGLDDGIKYFYRITLYDSEGGNYPSSVFSFSTPPRPRINNLRFQPVIGEPTSTQRITWDTNVATNSTVTYGKLQTNGTDIQLPELKTTHEIVIRGLLDDSEYFLLAQGRDAAGNLAVSDKQVFKTALDTRSPSLSDVLAEASIRGSGSEARGQIVVSWKTDEPSTSQVAYGEGSAGSGLNNKTAEDSQLTTEHLVIISDLAPGKVYSIAPISKDRSNNSTTGQQQTAIIGRASDSVLSIVLNTLKKVFGL